MTNSGMGIILGLIGIVVVITFLFSISTNTINNIQNNQEANSTVWNSSNDAVSLMTDVSSEFPSMGVFTGAIIVIIIIIVGFSLVLRSI